MAITLTHYPAPGDLLLSVPTLGVETSAPRPRRHQAPAVASCGWEITDHVCIACLGRILQKNDAAGVVTVKCSNCGLSGAGTVTAICWCGHKLRASKGVQRFKCRVNEKPTPEFPNEIEVVEL